ncbi:hypothetical protein THAOC_05032 [Thalassiosira oceanica]|uniref:Uncharacterized protein n=1 Tax=Thalassiosira oceanica TaxID=159749 RepID=K0T8B3_THAOC|nr:hypothetical protein THAOC_05032 [Thalassiosira oceanica]|eukprot:EJK73349.1 hypothetical protein THAOC_05032 [Thalassiosira oceanica]
MAGCFPSLAALAGMQKLMLVDLNMGMKSSAALGAALPQMANLLELELWENSIDDNMVEVLVPGLAECKRLNLLDLVRNRIGDDGLDVLIQGLPTSIDTLVLKSNQITLAQHLALLRLKELDLSGNTLSSDGPRVIAASLTNPECRLEALHLDRCSIGDEGAAVLAESMRYNQRLTKLALQGNAITETGWDVFSSVLCDTTSINATHGSNHALQSLGYDYRSNVPRDVETLLDLNDGQDKNLVAATKILQTHRHLDMRPLFCGKLLLLPHVVAWLERFAESWLDLKLSSIYEFARAMPMEVVGGVVGEKRGKKRMHSSA